RHSNQFWKLATADPQSFTITALLQVGSTIVAATAGQGVQLYDSSNGRLRYLHAAGGVPAGVVGMSLTQLLAPAQAAAPVPALPGPCRYVDTRKLFPLCGPFLRFYHSAPSSVRLRVFGNVISGPLYDRTQPRLIVQYFERARFEYRPDSGGTVTLTPLGVLLTRDMRVASSLAPMLPSRRFPTGFSAGGPFLKFWLQHDGATMLGYPISPLFEGTNGDGSGRSYIMQYFQYARLEYHTELRGTGFSIELGALGEDYLHCMQNRTYCNG
ncbi:MAG TPA: hypothetical protein VHB98_10580, partial [Chloroflexota bacterium]|nr:hypothetical protein [Chloroflexota bacterium]